MDVKQEELLRKDRKKEEKSDFDADAYWKEAFTRNIGIISDEDQQRLRKMTVVIAGLGGVGGIYATTLARLGVGHFRLADPDTFERVNINRQALAFGTTIGKNKAVTAKEAILDINPYARVEVFSEGVTMENVDRFLRGATIALDGIDFFEMDVRRLLFRKAQEHGVWALTAPPIGYGASLIAFHPRGMSFDQYFDIADNHAYLEKMLRFTIGLSPALLHQSYFRPQSIGLSSKKVSSLVLGTLACANVVGTAVVKIAQKKRLYPAPWSMQFDSYVRKFRIIRLRKGNRHFWQRFRLWIIRRKFKELGNI